MDNLTHSLFGLTLARTPLGRAGRGTTAALFLASNAPDIDIVVTAAGGATRYLELHRGPTHGPLGLLGLALVVGALVWAGQRRFGRKTTDPPASFAALCGVAALGILCHVLMDLPTSYGTRALAPFSWTWFAVDWMPIVDVYLLAILGGAFWFSRQRANAADVAPRRRKMAAVALSLMAANYGVRAASHQAAIARAPEVFGARLPAWCEQSIRPALGLDWWPRFPGTSPRDLAANRCLVELAATPDFLSPFRWRLIAHLSNGYELRDTDLLSDLFATAEAASDAPVMSVRVPNQWTPAVARAATAPHARTFLGFSRFPAARSVIAEDGRTVVRWSDMRFAGGPMDNERFRRGLFGAAVLIGTDGTILRDTLGP